MKQGYLYQKNESELKKDLSKNIEVTKGVDLSSILDTINIHEINYAGKPEVVLSLIKQEVMLYLDKITIKEEVKNEKD